MTFMSQLHREITLQYMHFPLTLRESKQQNRQRQLHRLNASLSSYLPKKIDRNGQTGPYYIDLQKQKMTVDDDDDDDDNVASRGCNRGHRSRIRILRFFFIFKI